MESSKIHWTTFDKIKRGHMNTCRQCKHLIDDWNKQCGGCGMRLVLEPDEEHRAKYLRGPALGALFFTQGWTFGARLYVWFLFSLIPVVGIVVNRKRESSSESTGLTIIFTRSLLLGLFCDTKSNVSIPSHVNLLVSGL